MTVGARLWLGEQGNGGMEKLSGAEGVGLVHFTSLALLQPHLNEGNRRNNLGVSCLG